MTEVHFYKPEVPLSISIDRVGGQAMTGRCEHIVTEHTLVGRRIGGICEKCGMYVEWQAEGGEKQ